MEQGTDIALQAAHVDTSPGAEYADDKRIWQGIPGIERTDNGRLWAVWYSGGRTEEAGNYVLLATSSDNGETWSGPKAVVDPGVPLRAFDPTLWRDPQGRMRLFWAQSKERYDGRAGVWISTSDNAGSASPSWSEPIRISNGVMMNKPTVLSTGEWLLPVSVWTGSKPREYDLGSEKGANVIVSSDEGKTWSLLGQAKIEDTTYHEHMIVERKDGSLWMLSRTKYGVAESVSTDRGKTWSLGKPSEITNAASRFFIRRLSSGRLLLIKHTPVEDMARSHLTAYLSDDDGETWYGGLLLDEQMKVSYPDGVQAPDGTIYIIYDFERFDARQILMARFTEDDVKQGKIARKGSRLKILVNQATGPRE